MNWDTAHMYGDSEELLGKWFDLHPERRQDIFLATKFGLSAQLKTDSSPEYCREQCETSLKRLKSSYIDLFYIHRVDGITPIEKTVAAMAELKRYATNRRHRMSCRNLRCAYIGKARFDIWEFLHHLQRPSAVLVQ